MMEKYIIKNQNDIRINFSKISLDVNITNE